MENSTIDNYTYVRYDDCMKIQVKQLGISKWVKVNKVPIGVIEWRDKTDYYHWRAISNQMSESCDCSMQMCTHWDDL